MTYPFTLISHSLCPYVQRAAIVLAEKSIPFDRTYIDLSDKPDWFKAASPLGKVPLLKTGNHRYLFESAPIVEFIDETQAERLHPDDPVERATHRAYVEFASQILNGIGALYSAADEQSFENAKHALRSKFEHLDTRIDATGPYFDRDRFSIVDAAFGPVFRYFDVFDTFTDLGIFNDLPRVRRWRCALAVRPSVANAVTNDYATLLRAFVLKKGSWITGLMLSAESESPAHSIR
ncbi:glutathione S-transferase family protein [Roseibium album]|uniref:glutathione transferase n=1 Tax=Roseibium album TaxID=311410 RepID=A0A0M7AC80_9HYPH|nr:glutathione S-transferase family protein [Roseibium album]CTQ60973.1 Glutathione S-transferase GST-6.0 [Roseibium album]CTQ64390.1 Glutathione S-transferase GST-6.0 [Roseibium album]CTQ72735.1 Glutathione S-transferase GST-6.0 [Roseibium album]